MGEPVGDQDSEAAQAVGEDRIAPSRAPSGGVRTEADGTRGGEAPTAPDEGPSGPAWTTRALPEAYDLEAPDGSEIRLLVERPGGSMVHCCLPPGRVTRAVRHRTVEEVWYFLSGIGEVWRRDGEREEVVEARPGLALSIPLGTHFQFRTVGAEPLVFLIVTMPPWPGPDEAVFVDVVVRQDLRELVLRVLRMIGFDARVPSEEAQLERFHLHAPAVALPAFDELVPEARGRPILDGPRGGRRDLVVLVRVEPLQLVAEVQRRARAEAALAELGKVEAELPSHAREQLEVRGPEMKRAALDAAELAAE